MSLPQLTARMLRGYDTAPAALVSKLRGFSMKLVENGESPAVYPQRVSRLGFIARCLLALLYVWVRV